MKRWKIVSVFGTRPEAIKMAPVIKEMERNKSIQPITIATAQHRQMLDELLRIFDINVDYDLDIMTKKQTLFSISEKVIKGMGRLLLKIRPDMVLVQGDTTTAFVSALCAFYLKIPCGHVEAGLRSFNRFHPFPEEMNRRIISSLADLHFAPTKQNAENLARENVPAKKIIVTGNPVIDALKLLSKLPQNKLCQYWDWKKYLNQNSKLILVTAHRRENWGMPLRQICSSILSIAERHRDIVFLYPVHFQPNVRRVVMPMLSNRDRIHLIDPLPYQTFIEAMSKSFLAMSDSGGVQEEGPALGKPVLVLRETTERPEGVSAGAVKIIGTDKSNIVMTVEKLLTDSKIYEKMSKISSPYGDGRASKHIVFNLLRFLKTGKNRKEID